MKSLLSIGLFVLVSYNLVAGDQELANRLKPFEQYSPYQWTKWLELRPPATGVAAAVAYTQPAMPSYKATEEDDELDSDESPEVDDPVEGWFKRALASDSKEKDTKKTKKTKSKSTSETTPPKPTIVPMSFWGPPPTTSPNETVLLPPGYWAAKKSMFIAKLFEALAVSVLNSTGPPTEELPTTTMSPKDAILNELQTVLLSNVARSLATTSDESEEESTEEPENKSANSEESTEEPQPTTKKAKVPATTTVTPTTPAPPTTTTIDPILLGKLEFLSKLSEAIANQQSKLATEPLTTTTPQPTGKFKGSKKGAKSKKKSSKKEKGPTTPKWMKFVPTTTTTPPPPTINYDALAKILLGDQ